MVSKRKDQEEVCDWNIFNLIYILIYFKWLEIVDVIQTQKLILLQNNLKKSVSVQKLYFIMQIRIRIYTDILFYKYCFIYNDRKLYSKVKSREIPIPQKVWYSKVQATWYLKQKWDCLSIVTNFLIFKRSYELCDDAGISSPFNKQSSE